MNASSSRQCAGEKKRILTVCTANVCRSPFVASLLQHRVKEAGLEAAVCVESAGVRALPGHQVDPIIAAMLTERAIALAGEYATPVAEQALREADLVLVMEETHRQALFYRLPDALPKIYLLSELSGRFDEVADPHGLDKRAYETMASLVTELLDQGWPRLLQRLQIGVPPQA
jgi:protein-tyrosine phosphatase